MSDRFDLAIVGAGFSGSLLAAIAAGRGGFDPVDPRDVLEGAGNLGASRADVEALLETWFPVGERPVSARFSVE